MERHIDLTTGSIVDKLVKLAIPIMGVSFIQTAYNLIDMMWIGRLGSNAVAAVGTAGFFTWLAEAFIMSAKLGVTIKVSQSIGQKDYDKTKSYIISGLQINFVLAALYGITLLAFHNPLVNFFNLGNTEVIQMAKTYLITVALGMIFFFSGPVFSGIFNGMGDSKTPFIINTIGLVFNMIFDPVLIFGLGGFPKLGVLGAALATVMAQIIVTVCFIIAIIMKKVSFLTLNIFKKPKWDLIKEVAYIGLPGALQSGLFTTFSMIIGRLVAYWGPTPIAAQKIGSQIEALSWLTAGGFSTAIATYVGQNYGAGKNERIHKGVRITMGLSAIIGAMTTLLLIFAREPLMKIFVTEPETIEVGKQYLLILGYSQLFMCAEITITGAFNGIGRTYLPNIISIILTGSRIPLCLILIKYLDLDGIWWSISITSILKGIILVSIYCYLSKQNKLIPSTLEVSI
ncbi:MATE family efflux transporter [Cellulosilyticum ruminicola]|uniref:MATE family efflux transporter n=1 Tax=Cellulosilyticum ruminicola TaxID=425254 RepID=UPI0006CFA81D|nr:MATE family efflux transporter [Cellulosilyticum ruminicola]